MPTTRSKRTDENEELTTTNESSETTQTSTDRTTATESEQTTATEHTTTEETLKKATSVKSIQSTKKKAIKLARAKEELLNLQVKLAAARLAAIEIDEDSDDDTVISDHEATSQRVSNWLDRTQNVENIENPRAAVNMQPSDETTQKRSQHRNIEKKIAARQIDLTELASAITIAARSGSQQNRLVELPSYGGSHQDWLSFKAAYQETVKTFTETENMNRLRRALRGRAREAVENLLIYNAKTKDIMKSLEARFGRPDCIALAEMERLRALPRISDNPRDICIFASRVSNTVATLQALQKIHYLYNPEAIKITIEKLTPALRYRWFDYASEQKKEEPDLEKLARFLNRESERCGPYAQPEPILQEQPVSTAVRRQKTYNTVETKVIKCAACEDENHDIIKCKKFNEATIEARWEIAKEKRLCFACLRYRTRTHQCKRKQCEIENCRYWHHRLLHNKKPEDRNKSETVTSTWTTRGFTSYLKIVPVHISGPVGGVDTHALLDDGSTVTLIDKEIATKTGVTGPTESLHIEAIGEHHISSNSRRVDIAIRGTSQREFKIRARTISNLKLSPQAITERDLNDCKHLSDIKQQLQYDGAKPQVLIGQDNWQLLIASEVRRGQQHQPVASRTPLGWVLHGARTRSLHRAERVHFVNSNEDEDMNEQLKQYFAIESMMIEAKQPQNGPEQRALQKLEKEVIEKDGRYEAPLLWKRDDITMPNNYENTLKRLHNIEKKLDRDPELKNKYTEQMNALITKGYAEEAPPQKDENRTWYLPHFAVVNPMKPGKIRIVHDAAAKTRGVSLNDHLLKGPDLIQSLPGVLMRFRQRKTAITADIKEMFMQVKVKTEDRDSLRYLWRGNRRDNEQPNEYRMTSLIFGATCSPAVAIYVKNRNALKHKETDPDACDAIIRNHYVDDLLHSYDTEEEAIHSARRITEIHKKANYELRQWSSNSGAVIEALDPGTTKSVVTLDVNDDTERTLGIIWKPGSDEISFNFNMTRLPSNAIENRYPTKRETLRILMSLFDPLGLASPVTIQAKQIIQEIWRRGTGWDDRIDEDLAMKWTEWIQHMKRLKEVRIPRCYLKYSEAVSVQLHVFVDASETAYSAIAYWRATTENGEVHTSLIAAKAKVCPLKLTSVPRLELQAAVMGSRMGQTIIEEHDIKPESTTYWTDSKTVLTWLRTGPRTYRPFVAHRIAAIEENSTLTSWRWIPTKLNVADDATRDVPLKFDTAHRWFKGPSFLQEDPSTWPEEQPHINTATGEERINHTRVTKCASLQSAVPEIIRFSKWERLLRSTARVLQFIDLCRAKLKVNYRRHKKNQQKDTDWKNRKTKTSKLRKIVKNEEKTYIPISVRHLERAEIILIRVSQNDSFAEEIENIDQTRKGQLRSLSVEITDGLIRIKSRIEAAQHITERQRSPPLLSGDHHIAKLYIEYVHRRLHHAGAEATINECRTMYWITRLRPVTRQLIHKCVRCRIRKNTPPEPPTGNLPHCRLAHHQRPFSYTGLDYFGPLTVTVGRAIQKRYVALFTCLTTRAVHLEIAPSLNTISAVMALRRFIARRGCPTEIWSDNGTNLRGADRDLRKAIDNATEKETSKRSISWRFIPPGAPFMGGAWERLVRSVKTALFAALSEQHPSDEVLSTVLAEVEFTVNNRPLTHVSIDPEDPEALTPNHFLLWGPAMNPAPGTFNERDLINRRHWRTSQRLADMFWDRWLKEYMPHLQERREPHGRGHQLQEGDIVLIVDNTLPRNTWPMGRIVKTYPGGDGVVRTVDIKTKGGVLRRPAKKLVYITAEDRPPATDK